VNIKKLCVFVSDHFPFSLEASCRGPKVERVLNGEVLDEQFVKNSTQPLPKFDLNFTSIPVIITSHHHCVHFLGNNG
jgi:hypothetical protein